MWALLAGEVSLGLQQPSIRTASITASFDCSAIFSSADVLPWRSPPSLYSIVATLAFNRKLVAIGEQNFNALSCYSKAAQEAVLVESTQSVCDAHKDRAMALFMQGDAARPAYEVLCQPFEAGIPDADIYTWWGSQTKTNKELLRALRRQQSEATIRKTAMAVLLFNQSRSSDRFNLQLLMPHASWNRSVLLHQSNVCRQQRVRQEQDLSKQCIQAKGSYTAVGIELATPIQRNLSTLHWVPRWRRPANMSHAPSAEARRQGHAFESGDVAATRRRFHIMGTHKNSSTLFAAVWRPVA
eukprot:3009721-Pleurochrysis_carterae.AAC.1